MIRFTTALLLATAFLWAGQVGAQVQPQPGKTQVQPKVAPQEALKRQAIKVSSPVEGILVSVVAKAGDVVQAGQILARVDDRLAALELERAQARIALAEADLKHADTVLKQAEAGAQRVQKLHDQGSITKEELAQALLSRDKARAALISRRARLKLVQIDHQQAKIILDMHKIRSPVAGTVRLIYMNRGEGVHKIDPVLQLDADVEKAPEGS